MAASVYSRELAGDLLRRVRSARGWSQRDLAAAAGVPPSTVGRIESASRQPTLPSLLRLLAATGVEAEIRLHPIDRGVWRISAPAPASTTTGVEWSAPVEVPSDLTTLRGPTDTVVHLPGSIYASGAGTLRGFDLRDELQRIEFYETVLGNGTAAQIAELLNANELIRLWPRLWLPRRVRAAWAGVIPFPTRAGL